MKRLLLAALCLAITGSAHAQTVIWLGLDRATQGSWRGVYALKDPTTAYAGDPGCVSLYPDGGNCTERMWARGAGTIQVQGMDFGGVITFDKRAPQRYTTNNCCDPVTYNVADLPVGTVGTGVVGTGQPWPPGARFAAGLYYREADGVPFRHGIGITRARSVCLYLVDFDRRGRTQRIDVYAEGGIVTEPGSLGVPHANGALLDSRVIDHFEDGVYACWHVSGPVIFQHTALPANTNGLAVVSAIFLGTAPLSCLPTDPGTPAPPLSAPKNLRIVADR